MYRKWYSQFFAANPDLLHFAAHSHHPWPDVTRQAQLQYWDDSIARVDRKWDYLYEHVIPTARQFVSRRLKTNRPRQIVFAPSTHELVFRVLSCHWGTSTSFKPIRILTTDSEFYSFDRQARRLNEMGWAEVQFVPVNPRESFADRFLNAATNSNPDVVYLSSIFFNTGLGANIEHTLVDSIRETPTTILLDGYHAFAALDVNLAEIADRAFFLAGGYKYAQSGEGVCFMHVPEHFDRNPINTGWFATFDLLSSEQKDGSAVPFPDSAERFAGATLDPTGIYRFNAVEQLLQEEQLDQQRIHQYVQELQTCFLSKLGQVKHPLLNAKHLIDQPGWTRGHFFVFELDSPDAAADLERDLTTRKIMVDIRGRRVRVGFGIYQDASTIDAFFDRIQA